jgi:hypothetical protein
MRLPSYLKVILLVFLSGGFLLGAFLTYDSHPQEASLWIPLSFFGSISFLFTLILGVRLYLMAHEGMEDEVFSHGNE